MIFEFIKNGNLIYNASKKHTTLLMILLGDFNVKQDKRVCPGPRQTKSG